jgi:crotonobetainyl-CoA:carnitine CoA-transferase CaiB-like acyl-CoA transferase
MLLGDMGAEVLKIEEPVHGDDTRDWAPFQDGVSTRVDHRDLVSEAKLAQRKLLRQAGLSPSPRWPVR